MKIKDVIVEERLRKGAQNATPDMETYPELNNNNSPYAAYRYGLFLATAPHFEQQPDKNGPIGGDFITIAYTDADAKIVNAASKAMGVKKFAQTSKGSREMSSVNSKSPIQPRGPVKRKK
jgi:hypothetical protein